MGMRRARYAVVAVALACSGLYLFVYLWRWEWHRALVAGLLFVAAEVGLATSLVLDRLKSIERRLEHGGGAGDDDALRAARDRIAEAAPEPRAGFAWLTEDVNRMSVFVPLLLGAGVVLSAVAWCVERVARATAGPVLERSLAVRLAPLTLGAGALRHGLEPPAVVARRGGLLPHLLVALLSLAAATVGVDALADATQTRPDPYVAGSRSSVVVSVFDRRSPDVVRSAQNLWGACASQLGARYSVVGMSQVGPHRVQVAVTPAIGKHGERRLRGCLEDGTSDRISATVHRIGP